MRRSLYPLAPIPRRDVRSSREPRLTSGRPSVTAGPTEARWILWDGAPVKRDRTPAARGERDGARGERNGARGERNGAAAKWMAQAGLR